MASLAPPWLRLWVGRVFMPSPTFGHREHNDFRTPQYYAIRVWLYEFHCQDIC